MDVEGRGLGFPNSYHTQLPLYLLYLHVFAFICSWYLYPICICHLITLLLPPQPGERLCHHPFLPLDLWHHRLFVAGPLRARRPSARSGAPGYIVLRLERQTGQLPGDMKLPKPARMGMGTHADSGRNDSETR